MTLSGLTNNEARKRFELEGPNSLPETKSKNLIRLAVNVVREPMLSLLVVAGSINYFLSELLDASILMLTVLIVLGISIYQERRTEQALGALRDLSSPRALVIREGNQIRLPGREVVRGDVILMAEGDRVAADAEIIEVANCFVDESMLTGESLPIQKKVGDLLFAGTLIVAGHGSAVVTSIGSKTELGKIGVALQGIEIERTRLQKEVDRIVRVIWIMAIAAALAVFVMYGASRHDWAEAALAGIAASMALIPEEFPVVLTLFLSLGAWRLSLNHVIARRAPVIEALGAMTVICVDKTGTLTMNQMVVKEIKVFGPPFIFGSANPPQEITRAIQTAALATPINPFDPMDKAIHNARPSIEKGELLFGFPLSDSLLAVTNIWKLESKSDLIVATKGAPEAIIELCKLNPNEVNSLMRDVEEATNRGYRVIGVAEARINPLSPLPDSPFGFNFEFLGLIHFEDPVRLGVPASVRECAIAGIRTIMITGDHAGTALSVAKEIGLNYQEGVITGRELNDMSDGELAERLKKVSIFARMVPQQKLRLVRALKMDGEVVGMTGDGVNDAPALRAADIGIAMGGRGTDVAREAASLVITDDDFTSIARGVKQGRGIFANMKKAMSYIIAVHVPIFGMALLPVFVSHWPLVLLPAQIAFLELVIDPACSIVYESEQADPKIMSQAPRKTSEKILDSKTLLYSILQGIGVLVAVIGIYLWAIGTGRSSDLVRTLTFATLMLGNIALILVNRSRHLSIIQTLKTRNNRTIKWIIGGAIGILVLLVNVGILKRAFDLSSLSFNEWIVVIIVGFGSVALTEVYKSISRLN